MKLFPINQKYTANSTLNYLSFLNHQIEGRKNYIRQFNPTYSILNEIPVRYTQEQLFQRGILAPARLNGEPAIIIFAAKLQYGEGIINNFAGYSSVWVYYGNPDNASGWKTGSPEFYDIPDEAVPDEVETDTVLADFYLDTYLVLSSESTPNASIFLNSKPITSAELFLNTAYPKTTNIYFNNGVYDDTKVVDGQMQKLPSSYYIISRLSNEEGKQGTTPVLSNEIYKDRKNYLFARTARGGGYYTWLFGYNPENKQQEGVCSFIEQATDLVGLKYLLDADFRQKRFYSSIYTKWEKGLTYKGFQSFFVNADDSLIFQIKTKSGSLWAGTNTLNHEFAKQFDDRVETLFLDDKKGSSTRSFKETAIPLYEVWADGASLLSFDISIYLW